MNVLVPVRASPVPRVSCEGVFVVKFLNGPPVPK